MADRTVHYEAAFEAFLRDRKIPCVVVDEAKRTLFANAKLKSFDFVVYSKAGPNLLIDVKGRQMKDAAAKRSFQTWTTERDGTPDTHWIAFSIMLALGVGMSFFFWRKRYLGRH